MLKNLYPNDLSEGTHMAAESRFDRERRWITEMEQLGPDDVRALHRLGKPLTSQPPHPDADFVEGWLRRNSRRRVRLHLGLFLLLLAVVLIAAWLVITL
jgi:hypothetical protein